jgi:hypothetical protein
VFAAYEVTVDVLLEVAATGLVNLLHRDALSGVRGPPTRAGCRPCCGSAPSASGEACPNW